VIVIVSLGAVGGRDGVIIVQPVLGMRWEEGCRDIVEVVKHAGSQGNDILTIKEGWNA